MSARRNEAVIRHQRWLEERAEQELLGARAAAQNRTPEQQREFERRAAELKPHLDPLEESIMSIQQTCETYSHRLDQHAQFQKTLHDTVSRVSTDMSRIAQNAIEPLIKKLEIVSQESADLRADIKAKASSKDVGVLSNEVQLLSRELNQCKTMINQLGETVKTKADSSMLQSTVVSFQSAVALARSDFQKQQKDVEAKMEARLQTLESELRTARQTIVDMHQWMQQGLRETKGSIEARVSLEQIKPLELLMEVSALLPRASAILDRLKAESGLTSPEVPPIVVERVRYDNESAACRDAVLSCQKLAEEIQSLEDVRRRLLALRDVDRRDIADLDRQLQAIHTATNDELESFSKVRKTLVAVEPGILAALGGMNTSNDFAPTHISSAAAAYFERIRALREGIVQGIRSLQEDVQTWRVCTHQDEVRARIKTLERVLQIVSSESALLEWMRAEGALHPVTEAQWQQLKEAKSQCRFMFKECIHRWKSLSQFEAAEAKVLEAFPTVDGVRLAFQSLQSAFTEGEAANSEFVIKVTRLTRGRIEQGSLTDSEKTDLEMHRQLAKVKCADYWKLHRKLFRPLRRGFPFLVSSDLLRVNEGTIGQYLASGVLNSDFVTVTGGAGPVKFKRPRASEVLQQCPAFEPLLPDVTQVFAIKGYDDLEHIQRELEAFTSMRHPYVGSFHFCYEDGGRFYIVMPKYNCTSMEWFDANRGTAPPEVLVRALLQIAEGVKAMHDRALIHCDLKPENIMFTAKDLSGVPKIIDFDCTLSQEARPNQMLLHITKTVSLGGPGLVGGTPLYLPPEILEAIQNRTLSSALLSPAVDVHCLGKTMRQLLMGTLAPTANDPSLNLSPEHCAALQQLFAEMTQQPERRCEMSHVLEVLRTVYSALNPAPGGRLVVARPLQTGTGSVHADPQKVTDAAPTADPLAVCMHCGERSGPLSRFLTCANGHSHCSACWLKSTGKWIVEMESEYVDAIPCPVQQRLKELDSDSAESCGCEATFPLLDQAIGTGQAALVGKLLLSLDGEREKAALTKHRARLQL